MDKEDVAATVKESLSLSLPPDESGFDKAACENRIKELQANMLDLIKESARSTENMDSLDSQFKGLSDEIKALQDAIQNHERRNTAIESVHSQMEEIMAFLETQDTDLPGYDETLARQLLEEVKVLSGDKVLITFKGGIESEQFLSQ